MLRVASVFLLATTLVTCQQIVNYNQVASAFVQQYYSAFDNAAQRQTVQSFYDVNSVLLYNGVLFIGVDRIMTKFTSVSTIIKRTILFSDYQPTNDAGVIVNVLGRILTSDPNANSTFFNEMLVLKPRATGYYIQNQQFRQSMVTSNGNIADGLHFV